jgi:hypothetical protein
MSADYSVIYANTVDAVFSLSAGAPATSSKDSAWLACFRRMLSVSLALTHANTGSAMVESAAWFPQRAAATFSQLPC